MRSVQITITIGKEQVMSALRRLTVDREDFDPGPWSIWDAEILEAVAALIRREIDAPGEAR